MAKNKRDNKNYSYEELDEVLHSRIRLAIVSALASLEEAEFTWLKEKTGASDGNLASHLRKLEEAEYVTLKKTFIGRKPVSIYSLSAKGENAFNAYIKALRKFIGQ